MKKEKIVLIRNDGEFFILHNINIGESFSWWFKMMGFVGYFEVLSEEKYTLQKKDVQKIIFWSDIIMTLCHVMNSKDIFIQATHKDIIENEVKKCYVLNNTAYPIPGNIEPVLEIPQFEVKEKEVNKYLRLYKLDGSTKSVEEKELTQEVIDDYIQQGYVGYCKYSSMNIIFTRQSQTSPTIFWLGTVFTLDDARDKKHINNLVHHAQKKDNNDWMYYYNGIKFFGKGKYKVQHVQIAQVAG